MVQTLPILLVFLFASLASSQEPKNASGLKGTYSVVSWEKDGQPVPESEFRGSLVVFGDNEVTGTDRNKKTFFAAIYTIDMSSKPSKIFMTSTTRGPQEKIGGVVEVERGTIRICYDLPDINAMREGKATRHCLVLKRVE